MNALPSLANMLGAIASLPTTYLVHETRIDGARAKVAAIISRARRAGATADLSMRDLYTVDTADNGLYYAVALDGDCEPTIAGWRFLAVLDHAGEENVFRALGSHPDLERYRTAAPDCEHCKVARRRNETYVMAHEDGRIMQVGSTCLQAFLGTDPAGVLAFLDGLSEIRRELDEADESSGGYVRRAFDIRCFMAHVVAAIRDNGWISKAQAEERGTFSTSTQAFNRAFGEKAERPTDEDLASADVVLAWAREIPADVASDFLRNLRAACRRSDVGRNAGLIAAAVTAHQRALEAARPKPTTPSEHVGTVGERARGLVLTVTAVHSFDGEYGTLHIHRFTDPQGNVLVWKTTSELLEQGATYERDATIKEHGEYKGTKQTVLSRVGPCKPEKKSKKAPKGVWTS